MNAKGSLAKRQHMAVAKGSRRHPAKRRRKRVSTTGLSFSEDEDNYPVQIKADGGLFRREIHRQFAKRLPGRSIGSLQVHYCTKLKDEQPTVERFHGHVDCMASVETIPYVHICIAPCMLIAQSLPNSMTAAVAAYLGMVNRTKQMHPNHHLPGQCGINTSKLAALVWVRPVASP